MFVDRVDAGRRLGALVRQALGDAVGRDPILVVGLPRGGVPVAAEVAHAVGAPFDAILVRKVGLPQHRELAMGAIGEDGVTVVNDDVVREHRVAPGQFDEGERAERAELVRRSAVLRRDAPPMSMHDRVVIVVDDGLATGATARAACQVARARGARRLVLAVPVAPLGWAADLGAAADEYIAAETPSTFRSVGEHYRDFGPVSDRVVADLLRRAPGRAGDPEADDRN